MIICFLILILGLLAVSSGLDGISLDHREKDLRIVFFLQNHTLGGRV